MVHLENGSDNPCGSYLAHVLACLIPTVGFDPFEIADLDEWFRG